MHKQARVQRTRERIGRERQKEMNREQIKRETRRESGSQGRFWLL